MLISELVQVGTEGANPTSWDSIVPGTSHDTDAVSETDDIDTSLPSDTQHDTGDDITHSSSANKFVAPYLTFPSLSFDGNTKDAFMKLQKEDESLKPLWDLAKHKQKNFFVVNNFTDVPHFYP